MVNIAIGIIIITKKFRNRNIIPYIADIFKNRQGIASQALAGPVSVSVFRARCAAREIRSHCHPPPSLSALAIFENISLQMRPFF
jgi:hypothetical protein